MMKISLSGPLGCSFKWSGKFEVTFFKPDSPSGNLEPTFLTIRTNKKGFVFTQNNNYSII